MESRVGSKNFRHPIRTVAPVFNDNMKLYDASIVGAEAN